MNGNSPQSTDRRARLAPRRRVETPARLAAAAATFEPAAPFAVAGSEGPSPPTAATVAATDSQESEFPQQAQALDDTISSAENYAKVITKIETITKKLPTSSSDWQELETRIESLESLREDIITRQNDLATRERYYIGDAFDENSLAKNNLQDWVSNQNFINYNTEKIDKITIYYSNEFVIRLEYNYLEMRNGTLVREKDSYGEIKSGSGINKEEINLEDTEYLTTLIIKNAEDIPGIAKQISIYTSFNPLKPKFIFPPDSIVTEPIKRLKLIEEERTGIEHFRYARSLSTRNKKINLVCINSEEENNDVMELAKQSENKYVWIGLYHKKPERYSVGTRSFRLWRWADGSPYFDRGSNTVVYENWDDRGRGQPDNHRGLENAVVMEPTGRWNDYNENKSSNSRGKISAIYQIVTKYTDSKAQTFSRQIYKIDQLNPSIRVLFKDRLIDNSAGRDAANRAIAATDTTHDILLRSLQDLDKINEELEVSKGFIEEIISNLRKEQQTIMEYQKIGKEANEKFTNIKNNYENETFIQNIMKSLNNIFTNNRSMKQNLKEGLVGQDEFQAATQDAFNEAESSTANLLTDLDNLRSRELSKYISEHLIKRNNLFTNTVMDYMIHNDRGTDVNKVYNKVKQKNINTNRQVGINMYYSKMYKEYINIIKVIIVACALVIPVLILNSNYIIPKNITIFLVTVIIVFLVGFIIYKIYDLNYRDYKNFDKIKIPYDREAERMIKEGKLDEFENPLLGNLTCIADACCDVSMVYDSERNKCVLENKIVENFLGENFNNKEFFSNRNHFQCDIVEEMVSKSLLLSTENKMITELFS
jgi:hypothetical protein